MKVRYESFGGIIGLEKPESLIFADKSFMKKMGYLHSDLWDAKQKRLSAPTEIHFSLTGECNQNCQHCYMNSGPNKGNEDLSFDEVIAFVDEVAEMSVFHMALGGGESLLRSDLFEIAKYIRKKGMVPNLTTNGTIMDENIAKQCNIFGQINISLDSLSLSQEQMRDTVDINTIIKSIELLKKKKNKVGINSVVNRYNFGEIENLVQFAKKYKLQDIEFLRLKPQGRGKLVYDKYKCTPEQHLEFFPLLIKLSKKYKISLKMDCSYVPMLCAHNPDKKLLEQFYIRGCFGGDMLASVSPSGDVSPCSFASPSHYKANEFKKAWNQSEIFKKFYTWEEKAPEPCRSCPYLEISRGGCHVVTELVTHDFFAPDPDCPRVVEWRNKK